MRESIECNRNVMCKRNHKYMNSGVYFSYIFFVQYFNFSLGVTALVRLLQLMLLWLSQSIQHAKFAIMECSGTESGGVVRCGVMPIHTFLIHGGREWKNNIHSHEIILIDFIQIYSQYHIISFWLSADYDKVLYHHVCICAVGLMSL